MQSLIVVTGVNGFVGKHLVKELIASGHKVIGIGREENAHEKIADDLLEYVTVDLSEAWPNLTHQPDGIIHLAGLAAVGPSFEHPQDYISLNSAMVTNLCEHYVKNSQKPRIVIVSSGAVYDPRQPMPISEKGTVSFSSPYAISKVLTEHQAAYYTSRGLECAVVRPFNHIGPGQLGGFLVPDLIEKIRSRSDDSSPIQVGNLETRRDYTDVRDVVSAYRLIATHPKPLQQALYNVCSGESLSGLEVLGTISEVMGINIPQTDIDRTLIRPNDVMDIRGDNSVITSEFNWTRAYSFKQTIADILSA